MFAGVPYTFFIINFVVTAELFLIFQSLWVVVPAVALHSLGMLLSLREPRSVDLWVARVSTCGRVHNHALWQCNSYRP
jgi:type IV secretion system protein VirB3